MLPSIYFSDFFEDLTVPRTNLKNMDKMSKFEGTVQYKTVVGNVIWGIILVETIIAPIYFFGFSLYEPVPGQGK
jgi:hypothetical protein